MAAVQVLSPIKNASFTRSNGGFDDPYAVFPRFFIQEVEDQLASARMGRPIFKEEERVEIILPGNPFNRPIAKVTDEHRERWPEQYERFKAGMEISVSGTPIEHWPILKRSMVAELKALEIHTVEQVAALSDLAVQRIGMGGLKLRELAKAYLDDAAATAITSQMAAENDRLNSEIAALKLQNEQMIEAMNRLSTQLLALQNAPNAIAAALPMHNDPFETMRLGQAGLQQAASEAVGSSLDVLSAPKRAPGRPRKEEAA